MNPLIRPDRRCPKCESPSYSFRLRRTLDGSSENGSRPEVETKYRCRDCSAEWKERTSAPPVPPQVKVRDVA
jgi:DNA-directed RNA polymerase subunit M/transcription elongation factor TFIIS